MARQIVTVLALIALLTQATLGCALPGMVLCIKPGDKPCMLTSPTGATQCCCGLAAIEQESVPLTIHLSAPCSTDCGDCVEVPLPDDAVRATMGVSLDDSLGFLAIVCGAQAASWDAALQPNVAPLATGPPECARYLHAPVIASTRLLI